MATELVLIPDIHGRSFWKNVVKEEKDSPVVFLGDYVDPYRDEGITDEDALANFKEIIAYAKGNSNVTLLLGNHDIHYLLPGIEFSRYCREYSREIHQLIEENMEIFSLAHYTRSNNTDILISHAGVLSSWLERKGLLTQGAKKLCKHLNEHLKDEGYLYNLAEEVSMYRGGFSSSPSPVWADVRDHLDEQSPSEFFQIFAHTQLTEHIITEHWVCIDCREAFVLKGDCIVSYPPLKGWVFAQELA